MRSEPRVYDVGATVRITRGSLAGVTGVVVETSAHGSRSVISIDFWVYGVKVVLNSDDLELVLRNRRFEAI
jgi:transcription antitermination factor NusG